MVDKLTGRVKSIKWREYSLELAPMLTHIYNISVATHIIPTRWKASNIRPTPKETNVSTLDQLRPISETDVMSLLKD